MTQEEKETFVDKVAEYLANYLWVDSDGNVNLQTLLHDFRKDSRTYFNEI